jgi:Glycosyltransferase family 92
MKTFLVSIALLLSSAFVEASKTKDQWKEYDYKLSIAAIFQNDAPYLEEWIEYHKKVGVEHFYLYDNLSIDNPDSVLAKYIKTGEVELVKWPNSIEPGFWGYTTQPASYRDALAKANGKSQWLALIDTDEFLVPMTHKNLVTLLRGEFANYKAIYANWLMFGTGGVSCPDYKILKSLTLCARIDNVWNSTGKSIVRPEWVTDCQDPHFCILKPDAIYHGGDGKELHHGHNAKHIRINHYTFRDEIFLHSVKKARAGAWNQPFQDLLDKNAEFSDVKDTKILKFLK